LAADKGQKAEMDAFVKATRNGTPMPIPLDSLIETTAVTLAAERSAVIGACVAVSEIVEEARGSRGSPVIARSQESPNA
jgi:hypothetical protein